MFVYDPTDITPANRVNGAGEAQFMVGIYKSFMSAVYFHVRVCFCAVCAFRFRNENVIRLFTRFRGILFTINYAVV